MITNLIKYLSIRKHDNILDIKSIHVYVYMASEIGRVYFM